MIEKPFGTRLEEALELNRERARRCFDESQVFRIDHYLGKETVQNMLAFRFANGMFEPIWNRNYIDYVQITAAEDLGIGHARRLLRHVGRAARPGPEPHAPAAEPALHGAAGDVRRRRGARREGEGPARGRAADRREAEMRCAPSTRPGMAEGKEARRLSRGGGRPAGLPDRDLRGPAPRGGQLALGGRADLPAHRQAARPQGHGDRGDAEAGAAPRLPGRTAPSACSRTRSSWRCSRTRACRSRSARRSPGAACASGR